MFELRVCPEARKYVRKESIKSLLSRRMKRGFRCLAMLVRRGMFHLLEIARRSRPCVSPMYTKWKPVIRCVWLIAWYRNMSVDVADGVLGSKMPNNGKVTPPKALGSFRYR